MYNVRRPSQPLAHARSRSQVWDQQFTFESVPSTGELKVEVYDANLIMRDVLIGSGILKLSTLPVAILSKVKLPLYKHTNQFRGHIHLQVLLKPVTVGNSSSNAYPFQPHPLPPNHPNAHAYPQAASGNGQAGSRPSSQGGQPQGAQNAYMQPPATTQHSPQQQQQQGRPAAPGPLQANAAAGSYNKPQPRGRSNWILESYCNTNCWETYTVGKKLGEGTYGTTYLAKHKRTGETVAVKVINKAKLSTREEIEDVQREVKIMFHLKGHPNVVSLKEVFEDRTSVCLVMELCAGGELFDAIVKRGRYTEKDAASLMRTIVQVIEHCHNMNVVHRDLKPENFLLSDNTSSAQIKTADFGLSAFIEEGLYLSDIVGSAFYVAPEVLQKRYAKEADIWSCGVILYILLCGSPPFQGRNEAEIFREVARKELDLHSGAWGRITPAAKDCVRRMLDRNPATRATATQILKHEWLKANGVASDNVIELEVLTRMKKFCGMNNLKKEALRVIATNLPVDEIYGMKQMFIEIDKDRSGTITVEEFTEALRKKGQHIRAEDMKRIIEAADMNGDGTLDYEEFLAAMVNAGKMEREVDMKKAFQHFDEDGNGLISRNELTKALADMRINPTEIESIIKEVDKDGNGEIDYNEFCIMMRKM